MQKQINTIINGKGGVGKSFFAVNLIQFLKDRSIPHAAIDTDNENSTLKRFHPEAVFLDIGDAKEIDSIFVALEKTDLVVLDCRAASTDIFLDYFEELQIFPLLENAGAAMTRNPQTIGPHVLASEALNAMEKRKITSIVVVDEAGGVLGVVHLHDLWGLELI